MFNHLLWPKVLSSFKFDVGISSSNLRAIETNFNCKVLRNLSRNKLINPFGSFVRTGELQNRWPGCILRVPNPRFKRKRIYVKKMRVYLHDGCHAISPCLRDYIHTAIWLRNVGIMSHSGAIDWHWLTQIPWIHNASLGASVQLRSYQKNSLSFRLSHFSGRLLFPRKRT